MIHSNTNDSSLVEKFKTNTQEYGNTIGNIFVCCQMLSVGFDVPEISTIVHYTTTESHILYWQRNGRGLRFLPTKEYCEIFHCLNSVDDIKMVIENLYTRDNRITPKNIHDHLSIETKNEHCERIVIYDNFQIPLADLERNVVRILNTEPSPTSQLKQILRYRNKYEAVLYDGHDIIQQYTGIIEDIESILNDMIKKHGLPKFCLPENVYEKYVSHFELDEQKIKHICESNNIKSVDDYCKNENRHIKLPPYKFILNGGIPSIKNLSDTLFPKKSRKRI
jgi:hypothetical protein